MDIEEIIQRIVDNGRIEDMHELSDILEDVLEVIEKYDKDCYDKYVMKLYKMAFGATFTRQMAEEIVSKMRPFGEKISLEQSREIQDRYNVNNIDLIEFYVVLNSRI